MWVVSPVIADDHFNLHQGFVWECVFVVVVAVVVVVWVNTLTFFIPKGNVKSLKVY